VRLQSNHLVPSAANESRTARHSAFMTRHSHSSPLLPLRISTHAYPSESSLINYAAIRNARN
jgi:hypothetical protein